jgi:linoleoyl-CoA desaturase
MVILKIVKETAAECNYHYEYKTMRSVIAHFKHLKELGMKPAAIDIVQMQHQ